MRSVQALVKPTIAKFRESAFNPSRPAVILDHFSQGGHLGPTLPALHLWFELEKSDNLPRLNEAYLKPLADRPVSVEMTSGLETAQRFWVQDMPLARFIRLSNSFAAPTSDCVDKDTGTADRRRLYLAQCPLDSLHPTLQSDCPVPDLVKQAGRGDVYASNLWIGPAPTYTPLHKDPNPNLLVQLAGMKTVRLLPPDVGLAFYQEAQRRIMRSGSPAIRGIEMMGGDENSVLDKLVWHSDDLDAAEAMREESINAGEALFIPNGWWHSIKGIGRGVTASVNWWFR